MDFPLGLLFLAHDAEAAAAAAATISVTPGNDLNRPRPILSPRGRAEASSSPSLAAAQQFPWPLRGREGGRLRTPPSLPLPLSLLDYDGSSFIEMIDAKSPPKVATAATTASASASIVNDYPGQAIQGRLAVMGPGIQTIYYSSTSGQRASFQNVPSCVHAPGRQL